jgi:hypothetical protein
MADLLSDLNPAPGDERKGKERMHRASLITPPCALRFPLLSEDTAFTARRVM